VKCPYCGAENTRSGEHHQYLGQSDHKYLPIRLLGRRCSTCGRDYTIEQRVTTDPWTKPNPTDHIADLFEDEKK
jgi:endogenous inhibitor of DNA gyrase (YacG/DUF329 family)